MQFDVYENDNPASRRRFPYLLDVQADLMEALDTRMVVPLAPRNLARDRAVTRLMPLLLLDEEEFVAHTPQMAGLARRLLGRQVGNLASARTEILAALDLLFTGA